MVLYVALSGLLFYVEESLKAVCAFRGRCATDLLGKKQNLTHGSERNPYPILPFPEKLGRATDFRRKAFVHRTIERGLLKDFTVRMIGRKWDVNF